MLKIKNMYAIPDKVIMPNREWRRYQENKDIPITSNYNTTIHLRYPRLNKKYKLIDKSMCSKYQLCIREAAKIAYTIREELVIPYSRRDAYCCITFYFGYYANKIDKDDNILEVLQVMLQERWKTVTVTLSLDGCINIAVANPF